MSQPGKTDLILVGALVLLVAAALYPISPSPNPSPKKAVASTASSSGPAFRIENDDRVLDHLDQALNAVAKHQDDIDQAAQTERKTKGRTFEPVESAPQEGPLLPLTGGWSWKYEVFGDEALVKAGQSATLRVVHEPEGEGAGLIEIEQGDRFSLTPVYQKRGYLLSLPFIAPVELIGTRPYNIEGELLPQRRRLVQGAVWTLRQYRKLVYRYTDETGSYALEAEAVITSRAHAGPFETVVTPAGRFGAYRINWLDRVAISAEKRSILEYLTTKPYRRETMWVAPGIGIVKRDISYTSPNTPNRSIQWVLTGYEPANDCQFTD